MKSYKSVVKLWEETNSGMNLIKEAPLREMLNGNFKFSTSGHRIAI